MRKKLAIVAVTANSAFIACSSFTSTAVPSFKNTARAISLAEQMAVLPLPSATGGNSTPRITALAECTSLRISSFHFVAMKLMT